MKRIALAGGASCGKTSLARQLTTELYNNRTPKINAQHVPEFARDHINECRRRDGGFCPTMSTQQMFFHEQMAREDALDSTQVEFMITDSPIFLTIVYAWPLVTPANYNSRIMYEKLYDCWLQHYSRYDHIFVLSRDKPFFADGTRGGDEAGAVDMHERIVSFLVYHEIDFTTVGGSDHTRVSLVLREILGESKLQFSDLTAEPKQLGWCATCDKEMLIALIRRQGTAAPICDPCYSSECLGEEDL